MRILIIFILLFSFVHNSWAFLGLDGIVKVISDQVSSISDEVFKTNMLKETIDSAGYIKKNYDDSVRFYNDMRRLQEDPNGISKEYADKLKNSVENPADRFYYEVTKSANNQKGWYETAENEFGDYVQKNWDFSGVIIENIKKRDKQVKKEIPDALSSGNKDKVEEAKNQLLIINYEQMADLTRALIKNLELQNYQLKNDENIVNLNRRIDSKFDVFAAQLRQKDVSNAQNRKQKVETILKEAPKYGDK